MSYAKTTASGDTELSASHHAAGKSSEGCFLRRWGTSYLPYIVKEYASQYGVDILGYCLTTNHVHIVATRHTATGNPVRAGLVSECGEWRWSSARNHVDPASEDVWLSMRDWAGNWTPDLWRAALADGLGTLTTIPDWESLRTESP